MLKYYHLVWVFLASLLMIALGEGLALAQPGAMPSPVMPVPPANGAASDLIREDRHTVRNGWNDKIAAPSLDLFWEQDFSVPISSTGYYTLGTPGAALVISGSFLLTPDDVSQSGRIFYTTPAPMREFTATFRLYLGSKQGGGADGAAFVFCPTYDYLQQGGDTLDAACPNGYIVAFDTWEDSGDLVYLAYESTTYNRLLSSGSLPSLDDGAWHSAGVDVRQGRITVTLDGAPVISGVIPGILPPMGYFGFTAATGAATNEQRVDDIQVYAAPAVSVGPDAAQSALPGATVLYTETVWNLTGQADRFDLALVGNTWPATLSVTNTGSLAPNHFMSLTIQVGIPLTAAGMTDVAILRAASVASPTVYSGTASLTSRAFSGQNGYIFDLGRPGIHIVDTVLHELVGFIDTAAYGDSSQYGALSPDGQWLYASLSYSAQVLVISTTTHSIETSIPVGSGPSGMAFSPDGSYLFVANYDDDTVSVIDVAAQTVVATLAVGDEPLNVASMACLGKLYVINYSQNSASIIDVNSLSVVGAIPGLNAAWDMSISPNSYRAYVSNQGDGSIGVIDTLHDQVVASWPTGGGWLAGVDVSPDGGRLYVADDGASAVYVIDTITGSTVVTLSAPPGMIAGAWDVTAFPAFAGPYAYVSVPWNGLIKVVDMTSNSVVGAISLGDGSAPGGHALFPPQPPTCPLALGLAPSTAASQAGPGEAAVYTLTVNNLSGATDSFDLSIAGNAWPTALSTNLLGPISQGGLATFTVQVVVPPEADAGDQDGVIITVNSHSSPVYSDTAALDTTATCPLCDHGPGYVLNAASNRINLVDIRTHQDTGQFIAAPGWPWRGALSPDGSRLYASLRDTDSVLVLDTATQSSVTSIPVGDKPNGIALSLDGAHAFVANLGSSSVSVIQIATQAVVATIPVNTNPYNVAASPCLDKIYVTHHNNPGAVSVLDPNSLFVLTTIPGLNNPWDVVVSPSGQRAYVSNGNGTIGVIDTANDTLIETWSTGSSGALGALDVSPDGTRLYVSDTSGVIVLDTTTGAVVSVISAAGSPWDIETFPAYAGPFAYASNADGNIRVINTTSNSVTGTIVFGGGLRGLALFRPRSVCAQLPTAAFTSAPSLILAGQGVAFHNQSAGSSPLTYTWNYGDGSPLDNTANPVHTYNAYGLFTVTLTSANPYGYAVATGTVQVNSPTAAGLWTLTARGGAPFFNGDLAALAATAGLLLGLGYALSRRRRG